MIKYHIYIYDTLSLIIAEHSKSFLYHSIKHYSLIENNYIEEVAVGERISYWIRTPQVPGSRPGWYGTFY